MLSPISISDHNSILFTLPLPTTSSSSFPSPSSSRHIWLYNQDTNKWFSFLHPLDFYFSTSDVNHPPNLTLCTSLYPARLLLLPLNPLGSPDLLFYVSSEETSSTSMLTLPMTGPSIVLFGIRPLLYSDLSIPSFSTLFSLLPPLVISGPLLRNHVGKKTSILPLSHNLL